MSGMDQVIETSGPDVDAAITEGLIELGLDRSAVEIEVLDEGGRGLFGLGAREARVRLIVKPRPSPAAPDESPEAEPDRAAERPGPAAAPPITEVPPVQEDEDAGVAQNVLQELLALMGIEQAQVEVRRAEPAPGEGHPPLVLDVRGPGIEALVGRRGSTLAALQHITRLIVGHETATRVNLVVDVDGFKARREQSLRRLAKRLADQAVRTDRTVVLEPMPPHERRIIHLTLRDHPRVTTESIGEGDRRKVTIMPRS